MPEDTQESTQETLQRIHENVHSINPFKERDDHGPRSILAYRVFTALTWLLVVITSIYYTFAKPHEGQGPWHTIWGQNKAHHTAFTLNSIIVSIYWIILFILQIGYSYHLYNREPEYVSAACNVGSHFIFHNLLLFAFIMLWTRGYLWIAELIVVVNFINLSAAYFLHNKGPRIIHIATVSGPLAWNFVALYWCGAAMVNAHTLPARIVANIFVWSILAYGMFFLAAYRDYTMGFALSVLSAALGVAQFVRQIVAFQWIFAFVIMAVLFVMSASVMGAVLSGRDPFKPQESAAEDDRERAPLLAQD